MGRSDVIPRISSSWLAVTCVLLLLQGTQLQGAKSKSPNILFVLMDDLGFRDVGYKDPQFHTPTIDALHKGGIRFDKSYTAPNCGPSRASLLSGEYAYRMGLQGNAIWSNSPAAIPLDRTILPQKLKSLGYTTHLVGKWHQGFCNWSQTPTYRGFDSFYGFYLTKGDYFSHRSKKDAYDFRNNKDVDYSVQDQYSTHIFSERVRLLIKANAESRKSGKNTKPFFILLSHQAVHGPIAVPETYIDEYCKGIKDRFRQEKCGMMAAVDAGLANIMTDLRETGLINNTLIIFTSDDGGTRSASENDSEGSSNWPLRGAKRSLWEGGIRVNTFMYSESKAILPNANFTWNGLFYITDWYPTLVGFARKTKSKTLKEAADGFNHWSKLAAETPSDSSYRREFAYIGEEVHHATIRVGNWKLVKHEDRHRGWYDPPEGSRMPAEPRKDEVDHFQLFNIKKDPSEKRNMAEKKANLVQKLNNKLKAVYEPMWLKPVSTELDSDPKTQFDGVWSPGWC